MTTDSTLVLSATALHLDLQRQYRDTHRQVEFQDLPSLRREGLRGLLSKLRSKRVSQVVVTGYGEDLALFKDYLILVSLLARADRRTFQGPDGQSRVISLWRVPAAAARIAAGIAAGVASLAWNRWRSARLTAARMPPLRRANDLGRCLYLKPVLMFGLPVGGSVGHVAGVVNAFLRRRTAVRLLSSSGQGMLDEGVQLFQIPPPPLVAFPYELNQHLYHRVYLSASRKHAGDFKPDFIYQRYCLNDLTGLELRRRLGVPLILEFNGSEVWVQRHWGTLLRFPKTAERIELANLRGADLVVTVSEEIKRQVLEAGVPADRVIFYPNCVDPELFDPDRFDAAQRRKSRQMLGVPEDADLFTFVGTFGKWHGTEILAAAVRELIDSSREWLKTRKLHFLFVGDGNRAPAVRETLGPDLGAPHVTLAGLRPQSETPAILAASDVLLSPHAPNEDGSPFFGSPTKLFEYMAMAKLIVASDLDQIGRVLKGLPPDSSDASPQAENPLAILTRPGDVGDLIRGLRAAAEMDRARRRQFGARARAQVFRHYTWEKNVDTVMARFAGGEPWPPPRQERTANSFEVEKP